MVSDIWRLHLVNDLCSGWRHAIVALWRETHGKRPVTLYGGQSGHWAARTEGAAVQ